MKKCEFNSLSVGDALVDILIDLEDNLTELNVRNALLSFIKDYMLKQYYVNDGSAAADTIIGVASDFGIDSLFPILFDKNKLTARILDIQSGVKVKENKLDASAEKIEDPVTVKHKKDASIRFLDDIYGLARNVKDYFLAKHDLFLFDSLFINRGAIEGAPLGPVENSELLNDNIREYQIMLFNNIKDYLLRLPGLDQLLREDLTNAELFNYITDKNGNTTLEYTGILELLGDRIRPYLSVTTLNSDGKGDFLRKQFKVGYDRFTSNTSEKQLAKSQLDAYFAFHILNNFDSYLVNKLGNALNILEFNTLSTRLKYSISGTTSNLLTTWRTSEEINVEQEADRVTKLLINTTPVHAWGKYDHEIGGQYLHFNDFECIISKVKDIAFNPEASGIVFDHTFRTTSDIWESFGEETKELIKDKNLRLVISEMRKSPRLYSHVIFDILTNLKFYDRYKKEIYRNYSIDERNKLFTIGTLIFGLLKPIIINGQLTNRYYNRNSIYEISKHATNNDYYSYITLTADSIFSVNYILYYKDPRTGLIYGRTLYDSALYKRQREVSEGIRTANSAKRSKNLKEWENSLALEELIDTKTLLDGKSIRLFKGIKFKIPNSNVSVRVYKETGDVYFFDSKGSEINSFAALKNDPALNKFIKQVLRIDLLSNPDFLINLGEIGEGTDNSFYNLLKMASRSTMLKYVGYNVPVNRILETHQGDSRTINNGGDTVLSKVFDAKAGIKYNWVLLEIDTLHPLDTTTMKLVALTRSNLAGDAVSSILRDGKGNALSKNTLSRLLGNIVGLFDLIERQSNSATKDSIILDVSKDPETGEMVSVFNGVYTAKEYDDSVELKEMRNFTSGEMILSNFFFDFIAGLNSLEEGSLVGNGMVMFLPSVNSDKNTIGRIKINLNAKRNGIKFRNMTIDQIQLVISEEFGTTYTNILNRVVLDFKRVDEEIELAYPEFPVKLADGYKDNFASFNQAVQDYKQVNPYFDYKTPVDFVKSIVTAYNMETNLPIELIDLVHFQESDGNLRFNQTLLSQIARFDPTKATQLGIDTTLFVSMQNFFKIKNKEFLRSALKANFRIIQDNLSHDPIEGKVLDIDYLKSINGDWFDVSGKMILARLNFDIEVNGLTYLQVVDITSEADLYKSHIVKVFEEGKGTTIINDSEGKPVTFNIAKEGGFEDFFEDPNLTLVMTLNPILQKYNLFDYLFTQSFMNATVGSFIAHPTKGSFDTVMEEEAARFLALHKRNVQFTAAMHEFLLNLLGGIPEEYNISVIRDILDFKHTIGGENNKINPFDGATFVNPFIVLLENFSLGGSRAGVTKKQFVHFKNGATGTSGIIKTAGFGITNDWIRNSSMMQNLMRMMTDRVWRYEDGGESEPINIFRSYDDRPLSYPPIYIKTGDTYQERELIWNEESRNYHVRHRAVSKNCEALEDWSDDEDLEINSNYQLWNAFGGMNSAAPNEYGVLEYSDTSVSSVVHAMNNIGYIKASVDVSSYNWTNENGHQILSIDREGTRFKINTSEGNYYVLLEDIAEYANSEEEYGTVIRSLHPHVNNLHNVYQILKHSDIHYAPTEGAVKQGAANINSADKLYDSTAELDYLKIKLYLAGIQLDKEHSADDSELSLMTLVISACASRGYTFELAASIYDALSRANELNLNDHYKALEEYVKGNKIDLREVVIKTIVDNLGSGLAGNGNFAELISRDIILRAQRGEEIKYSDLILPLSDNTIYSKIFSIITSYLTKSGIKLKIPGVLAVLTPSYDLVKIHNNKKLEAFATQRDLELELEKVVPLYSTEFKFNREDTSYRGYPIVYQIESPRDLAIEDGTIYINPVGIESTFLRDNDLQGGTFNNLEEYINYRLIRETLKDKNGLSGEELEELSMRCLNIDSTDIELDRTYNITFNVHSDANGNPIPFPLNGKTYYVPLTEDFLNPDPSTLIDTRYSHFYILTPTLYRALKSLIEKGYIRSVTEDVITGRNLAAYNVRGTTSTGKRFLLWDLDSATAAFELNNKKDIDFDFAENFSQKYFNEAISPDINLSEWTSHTKIRVRRWLQSDLSNLSKSLGSAYDLYTKFLDTLQEKRASGVSEDILRTWEIAWANVKLGRSDGIYYNVNSTLLQPTPENWNTIKLLIEEDLLRSTRVRIGGEEHIVNKDTLKISAYEIIMPKRFKSDFDLDTYASVEEISNNKFYFLEQYVDRSQLEIDDPSLFTMALKRSDGKHIYVLDRSQLPISGIRRIPNIIENIIDGRRIRYDAEGNELYEMLREEGGHPEDDIFVDNHGHEIIVTDNIQFYAQNLHYDDIQISPVLSLDRFIGVYNALELVDKSITKRFLRHITLNGSLDVVNDYDDVHRLNARVISRNTMFNDEYRYVVDSMLEKHTSFLRSLDIVAARIPAQSMLSFMPMKTIAFENADINNAYVSTLLILLEGSDYDIDAVSLETYDIERGGRLLIWSPYSNLLSSNLLEASLTLPVPTGLELVLNSNRSNSEYNRTITFLEEYKDIIEVVLESRYNKETKLREFTGNIRVLFKNDSVNNIKKLALLLNELKKSKIFRPNQNKINDFVTYFNSAHIIDFPINAPQARQFFDLLKSIIDRHNMYFEGMSKHKLSKIINNHEIYSIYSLISDPVNLLLAHMPIDEATKPLKKRASLDKVVERDIRSRTAGNAINKFESICDNSVGKDGISITAVGLKQYFGNTHSLNTLLNEGDEAKLERILLGPNGEGVSIPGIDRKFTVFSNIRPIDPSTVAYKILVELALANLDIDSAVIQSALLSLSTDNAKELALSRLKAGTKTLGMYIYGLSIGMTFNEVSEIMMSDVAGILNDVAAGDMYNQEEEVIKIDSRFWEYFEKGPSKLLSKYKTNKAKEAWKLDKPYYLLLAILSKNKKYKVSLNPRNKNDISLEKMLSNLGKSLAMTLTLKLDFLENLKGTGSVNHSVEFSRSYRNMIDDIQQYIIRTHTVFKVDPEQGVDNKTKYEAIKALSQGASELRVMGAIFGINKGIKTTPQDLLSLIDNIRMLIYNRKKEMGLKASEADLIDIYKFFYDDEINEASGKTYRLEMIDLYEDIKVAINPLDAIITVPHYKSYFKTLILAEQECKLSYKYRETQNVPIMMLRLFGISNSKEVIKNATNFIGKFLNREFFKTLPNSRRYIEIPAGNVALNKNMEYFTLKEATTIDLSTNWGQETFKLWMENEVIPNMLNGSTDPKLKGSDVVTSNNLFIRELNWDLFRRTTSGNADIVSALSINMLPRTDSERAEFNTYKDAFNELNSRIYAYNTVVYDYNSGEAVSHRHSMNMIDMFALYAITANGWLLAENSLVPILEDFLKEGNYYIENYHKFVDKVDKGLIDIGHAGLDENGVPTIEYLYEVAPKESFNTSYAKIIKALNPKRHRIEFMRKLGGNNLEEFTGNDDLNIKVLSFNKYVPNPRNTDRYPSGVIDSPIKSIRYNIGEDIIEVTYNPDYSINSITSNGKAVHVKDLVTIPLKEVIVGKGETMEVVDEQEISEKLIKELYKCE